MSQLGLLIRVTRSHYALAGAFVLTIATAIWATNLPASAIQPSITSLPPAFAVSGLAAILAATLGAVPRYESLDTIGRYWPRISVRATTLAAVVLTPIVVSVGISFAADSPWHQLPLLTAGILLGSVTLLISAIAPPAAASLTGSAYVFVCFLAGHGDSWWDQVNRPSTTARTAVTLIVLAIASSVFLWKGSRQTHHYDDIL
jgi:hypothetical protein